MMYIGDLYEKRTQGLVQLSACQGGTGLALAPKDQTSEICLPALWSWEQILVGSLDLVIRFSQSCFVDRLCISFQEAGCVAGIEVTPAGRTGDPCFARLDAASGTPVPQDAVLDIGQETETLCIRLHGSMQDVEIRNLAIWGSTSQGEPELFPNALTLKPRAGSLPLSAAAAPVENPEADEDIAFCADYVQQKLPAGIQGTHSFVIRKDASLHAEGFVLDLSETGITLTGCDRRGLLYGCTVLTQLMAEGRLPLCHVEDEPRFSLRGIHMGLPPREEIPFFRRMIRDFLVPLHYNTIFLQFTAGMRFDSHPEINDAWENACAKSFSGEWPPLHHSDMIAGGHILEKDEVRSLIDYMEAYGFEIIPEIQSLSHVQYITIAHPEVAEIDPEHQKEDDSDERQADKQTDLFYPHSYCPSNEKSYEILFALMDEILEVARPRRFVHMGHDEVYQIGICPRCRGTAPDVLLERHIRRVHDYLAKRGLRMMIWGDMLQPDSGYKTVGALKRIPRDIVPVDFIWYFHLDKDIEDNLLNEGFQVVMGNLYSSHYPRYEKRSAKPGILGGQISTWCRFDYEVLAREGKLYDFAYTANMLWSGSYCAQCRGSYTRMLAARIPLWRSRLLGQVSPLCDSPAEVRSFAFASEEKVTVSIPATGSRIPAYEKLRLDSELTAVLSGSRASAPVNSAPDSLVFVQACSRQLTKLPYHTAPEVGSYTICFADGTKEVLPLRYGQETGALHSRYGDPQPYPFFRHAGYQSVFGCDRALDARDESGRPLTLYGLEWINTEKKTVTSVSCTAAPDCGTDLLLSSVNGLYL